MHVWLPKLTPNVLLQLEMRCVDLWKDAFAVEQGCSYTQFIDDPEHLRYVESVIEPTNQMGLTFSLKLPWLRAEVQ